MNQRLWTLGLLLAGACSSPNQSPWRKQVIPLHLQWQHPAQSEIVSCHIFKLPSDVPNEVNRITVDFPTGSHHVHVYRSDMPADDSVMECRSGIDWKRWSLLVGVQTET